MNKYLPLIMSFCLLGIFLWGMNNPKVGDAVIAISVVGITIFIISLGEKMVWKLIGNSK